MKYLPEHCLVVLLVYSLKLILIQNNKHCRYVWSSANDGVHSYLRIFGVTPHQPGLKEVGTVTLPPPPEGGAERSLVRCMQYVPGLHGGVPTHDPEPLRGDLVWVGTDAKR